MKKFMVVGVFAVFCYIPTLCYPFKEKIYQLKDSESEDNKTLLVATWRSEREIECEIWVGKIFVEETAKMSNDSIIQYVTQKEMQNLIDHCSTLFLEARRPLSEKNAYYFIKETGTTTGKSEDYEEKIIPTTTVPPTNEGFSGWNFIFPGTKWCGPGNNARHNDDLGFHKYEDMCCRAHDNCDDIIVAGKSKYNLTNDSAFTKLHCRCDKEFYDCLLKLNTTISNAIGHMYFNILERPCYDLDFPRTAKCKKFKTFMQWTCEEYEVDTNAEKVYQWFPPKKYEENSPTQKDGYQFFDIVESVKYFAAF